MIAVQYFTKTEHG